MDFLHRKSLTASLTSINLIGCVISLLCLYCLYLIDGNDQRDLFVLPLCRFMQIVQCPIYASIIVAIFVLNKDIPFLLPSNFYLYTLLSNALITASHYALQYAPPKPLPFSLSVHVTVLIAYAISLLFACKCIVLITPQKSTDKDKPKRVKNAHKKRQKASKRSKPPTQATSISAFHEHGELQAAFVRNVMMSNAVWHSINLCMFANNHMLQTRYLRHDYDVLLSVMWLYWTLEYYSYHFNNLSHIVTVDNRIILPYLLIIALLFQYEMFSALRIFSVVLCGSMIMYKMYQIYSDHQSMINCITKKSKAATPRIVYGEHSVQLSDEQEVLSLISALPLRYFFYSSFSSFGAILVPSIISVFWRVWHLIPILLAGDAHFYHSSNQDMHTFDPLLSDRSLTGWHKLGIVGMQFVHSMINMYITVKQYRIYIWWKHYHIIDIEHTLFVYVLHAIISKLPFIVFGVCLYEYWFGADLQGKVCGNFGSDALKPPMFILSLHYIAFVLNCWVVYYAVAWKHGDTLRRIRVSMRKSGAVQQRTMSKPLIALGIAVWVHSCGRVFSIIREDNRIEILHIASSLCLLAFTIYRHSKWLHSIDNQHENSVAYGMKIAMFVGLSVQLIYHAF